MLFFSKLKFTKVFVPFWRNFFIYYPITCINLKFYYICTRINCIFCKFFCICKISLMIASISAIIRGPFFLSKNFFYIDHLQFLIKFIFFSSNSLLSSSYSFIFLFIKFIVSFVLSAIPLGVITY